jgi:hypothetical protein
VSDHASRELQRSAEHGVLQRVTPGRLDVTERFLHCGFEFNDFVTQAAVHFVWVLAHTDVLRVEQWVEVVR